MLPLSKEAAYRKMVMAATDISDAGVAFIASFEGFVATPYDDPSGNCTVGYGYLLHFGNCTSDELAQPPISEASGMLLLRQTLRLYVAEVVNNCRPLNQNELDALSSLCYNIGRAGFARSSVRTAVNAGGDVCAELRQYVHGSDGAVLPGLVRRREAECQLFSTPVGEDDDMKPFLVWDSDRQRSYFIGAWGAAWITDAGNVAALEAIYGKTAIALPASVVDAIGAARAA